jgi:hypothetical protein
MLMVLCDKLRQKAEWHRAELTPDHARRQQRRSEYDKKYGMCRHGTHPVAECDGRDDADEENADD